MSFSIPLGAFNFALPAHSNAEVAKATYGWYCDKMSDWETDQIKINWQTVLKNSILKECDALTDKSTRVTEISVSVTNRELKSISFNSQVVGFSSTNSPTVAIKVNPVFDLIPGAVTETATGDSHLAGSHPPPI